GNAIYANKKFAALAQGPLPDLSFLSYFSAWVPRTTLEDIWSNAVQGEPTAFALHLPTPDRSTPNQSTLGQATLEQPSLGQRVECSLYSPIPGGAVLLKIESCPPQSKDFIHLMQNYESQFVQLFNTPSLAIALMDGNGQGFRFNDRFRETFQLPPTPTASLDELVHPEDQNLDIDLRQRLVRGELPHYTIEQRFVTQNQDVIWTNKTVLLTHTPFNFQGGKQHFMVLLEDITETKKVYHALARSESKWHEFVSTSSNLYLECGPAGQIVYASPMIKPILGYSPDEVLDSYLSDLVHPEDLNHFDQSLRLWTHSLETGKPGIECRWQNKAGQWVYLYLQGKRFAPSIDSTTLLIQAYNVTDRKILEDELTRFKTLALNIPGAAFRCSAEYQMGFLSQRIEEITGYPATDFINNRIRSYLSIVYPPDQDKLLSRLLVRSASYSVEYRIIHADGHLRQVSERGQRMYDRNGNLLWMDGIIFDIDRQQDNMAPPPQQVVQQPVPHEGHPNRHFLPHIKTIPMPTLNPHHSDSL
ncbi:MAG TPA: PAS domain-containing protein, partial [Coleofasciculaceae cyanobacterium]